MPEVGDGLLLPPQLLAIATIRMTTLTPTAPRAVINSVRVRSLERPPTAPRSRAAGVLGRVATDLTLSWGMVVA